MTTTPIIAITLSTRVRYVPRDRPLAVWLGAHVIVKRWGECYWHCENGNVWRWR